MARAALARRAIDGPCSVMWLQSGATPVCCFWRQGGPLMARTDPARRSI